MILTIFVFLVAGVTLWFSGDNEPTVQWVTPRRSDSTAPGSPMSLLDFAPTIAASKTLLAHINPDAANHETQISDTKPSISTRQTDHWQSGAVVAESQISSLETKPDLLTPGIEVSFPESRTETYVSLPSLSKIRSRPDLSAPVLQHISEGTRVQVVAKEEDWLQLELKGGKSGWIHHSLVRQEN